MPITAIELNAIIGTIFAGIAACMSAAAAIISVKSRRNMVEKVQEIHLLVNSRMDQLLKKTETEAVMVGEAKGRADLHQENRIEAALDKQELK